MSFLRGVRLTGAGLEIGGEAVPLLVAGLDYFRLEPKSWADCLRAVRGLGVRLVDVRVPWGLHEIAPGRLELGERDPQLDLSAFLRLVKEAGLYAIVRPGPQVGAELSYFGLPERIVWDARCQAKSPTGRPVVLPLLPVAFPIPSYASEVFHEEVARYFEALAPALGPALYPDGPVVLLHVDSEGAFYFRDGAYDLDYHPDALTLYRSFLRDRYGSFEALHQAYGEPARYTMVPAPGERTEAGIAATDPAALAEQLALKGFDAVMPPLRFDGERGEDLARHLDWAEFQEHLLAHGLARFARSLQAAGLGGLPTVHNLPLGQEATPLNAARMGRAVDLVGLDYYYRAGTRTHMVVRRRTTELAQRCEAMGAPAYATEMAAGFPPLLPPLQERDSVFTALTALAYGLRGMNIHLAVERDRWIGAPISRHGRPRPFAEFWRSLCAAIERTRLPWLRRRVPVRLVVPRTERRLSRVMHAFGPVSGALFSVFGGGPRHRVLEDELDLGRPVAMEADQLARTFEAALEARGVPFAHVGGEDREHSLRGAQWIICVTSGAMHPELFRRLEFEAQRGARITLGPRAPTLDGAMLPLLEPFALDRLGLESGIPRLVGDDPAAADAAVARAILELDLPVCACDPDGVFATVHEDDEGQAKVLFLINTEDTQAVARTAAPAGCARAEDALYGDVFEARRGTFEVPVPARSARMLALG